MIFDQRKRSCPKNKLLFNTPFFAANLSTPCQLESSPCVQVGELITSKGISRYIIIAMARKKSCRSKIFGLETNNKKKPCFGPRFIRTRSIWRSSILASPSARPKRMAIQRGKRLGWGSNDSDVRRSTELGVWKLVTVMNLWEKFTRKPKWSICLAMQYLNL